MKTIFTLLIFCCTLSAQDRIELHPFLTASTDVLNNLGYSFPLFSVGGGAELSGPHMFTETRIQGSIAHKLETKDGRAFTFENVAYARFGSWLAGGGSKYSLETTSQWSKGSNRPFAAAGYEFDRLRLTGRYLMPIWDVQNGLHGVQVRADMLASKHWHVELTGGFYRFHDTRVPGVDYGGIPAQSHSGSETGMGVKYVL